MIPQGHHNLRCPISNCQALMVCVDQQCSVYPIVCGQGPCSCQIPHRTHMQLPFHGYMERVCRPLEPSQEMKKIVKAAKALFGGLVEDIKKCEAGLNRLMEEQVSRLFTHNSLRQALVNRDQPSAKDMTGRNMRALLSEIEQAKLEVSAQNLKAFETSSAQLRQHIASQLQRKVQELWNRLQLSTNDSTKQYETRIALDMKTCELEPRLFKFGVASMQSQRYVSICNVKEQPNQEEVVIVDVFDKTISKISKIGITSCLLDRTGELLAVQEGRPSKSISFYSLKSKNTVQKLDLPSPIFYWTWVSDEKMAVVTRDFVYHINKSQLGTAVRMFDRRGNLTSEGIQIIGCGIDCDSKWASLLGISSPDAGKTINGSIQLMWLEESRSQLLDGFACTFTQATIKGLKSNIFSFVQKKPEQQQYKLMIIEISSPPNAKPGKHKLQLPISVDKESFPLSTIGSQGLLYLITKSSWVSVYDIVSGSQLLNVRIMEDITIMAVAAEQGQGIQVVGKSGNIVKFTLKDHQLAKMPSEIS